MERYNSFNLIHKALRAMLYDTALTLQTTYFAEVAEAKAAIDNVESIIYFFEQHAHHEDTFMLPAIQAFEPTLVEAFENEHVADLELGNRLATLLKMYEACMLDEEKVNCGSAINKCFRDFMVFNIEHMGKEESEINRVLWTHYTDEELIALNGRLVASIPPGDLMTQAKWILRSINKNEAVKWLKGVCETAPSFVFEALMKLADTELPKRFKAEVQDAVMAGFMAMEA